MKRIFRAALLAAISALLGVPGLASAQEACPEGRTGGGDCVNAGLAGMMRQSAIIYAQPQISETAYPILPLEDYTYRYPHSLVPNPLPPTPTGTPFSP